MRGFKARPFRCPVESGRSFSQQRMGEKGEQRPLRCFIHPTAKDVLRHIFEGKSSLREVSRFDSRYDKHDKCPR